MISLDTNLLLHAQVAQSPHHRAARAFLESMDLREDFAISEFVLVEVYRLLRNPAVVRRPLDAPDAAAVVAAYRGHPRWRIVGFTDNSRPLHDTLWSLAAQADFAVRRVFDARLALTLRHHGVTDFATANVKDFEASGFRRVWNPLDE